MYLAYIVLTLISFRIVIIVCQVSKSKKNFFFYRQYQIAVKASSRSRISYSALSNEDIEFLKAKPNLSKLVDSQQKLHKSVLQTRELLRRASELDEVILTNSEAMIDAVTNYILENSTLDIAE